MKELIKLNEKHTRLVTNLKRALVLGQGAFLRAGAILAEIKDKETYKAEDAAHEWTWRDFIARSDLPLPGKTMGSRRRIADALIRVHRIYQKKLGYDQEELAIIGWTKLDLIAPIIEKETDSQKVDVWIEKAKNLTVADLALEVKGDGYDINCRHENAYQVWYCPDCGSKFRDDPRPHKS